MTKTLAIERECVTCLKRQHIRLLGDLCLRCARGRTKRRTRNGRVPFWYQFLTGTYDGWMPRDNRD